MRHLFEYLNINETAKITVTDRHMEKQSKNDLCLPQKQFEDSWLDLVARHYDGEIYDKPIKYFTEYFDWMSNLFDFISTPFKDLKSVNHFQSQILYNIFGKKKNELSGMTVGEFDNAARMDELSDNVNVIKTDKSFRIEGKSFKINIGVVTVPYQNGQVIVLNSNTGWYVILYNGHGINCCVNDFFVKSTVFDCNFMQEFIDSGNSDAKSAELKDIQFKFLGIN